MSHLSVSDCILFFYITKLEKYFLEQWQFCAAKVERWDVKWNNGPRVQLIDQDSSSSVPASICWINEGYLIINYLRTDSIIGSFEESN